jgi:hypothetical protein
MLTILFKRDNLGMGLASQILLGGVNMKKVCFLLVVLALLVVFSGSAFATSTDMSNDFLAATRAGACPSCGSLQYNTTIVSSTPWAFADSVACTIHYSCVIKHETRITTYSSHCSACGYTYNWAVTEHRYTHVKI